MPVEIYASNCNPPIKHFNKIFLNIEQYLVIQTRFLEIQSDVMPTKSVKFCLERYSVPVILVLKNCKFQHLHQKLCSFDTVSF